MSLISLRQLLDHAAGNNYGVPAFNVNNLDVLGISTFAGNISLAEKIVHTDDTNTSINSGFYWGYSGLIKNIINLIMKKTKLKYKII